MAAHLLWEQFLNKSIYNKQDLKGILLETRVCRECKQQDILVNFPLAGEIKGKNITDIYVDLAIQSKNMKQEEIA